VTRDPRAFLALDLGAATSSVALVGRVAGHWRLLGSLSCPSDISVEALVGALVARAAAADPELAAELGVDPTAAADIPRLVARSAPPAAIGVVAASERSLAPLVAAAERSGWRVHAGSAERLDPLAMSRLLLDPTISTVLAGAGDPPGADERSALPELAALVAGVGQRRPEIGIVLAGALAEHQARFESHTADGSGDLLLGPAPTAGTPPGSSLGELLGRLRAPGDDARRSIAVAIGSLAEGLDRRIEVLDVGIDGGLRVVAAPGGPDEPARVVSAAVARAALAPEDVEDAVDGALGWATVSTDRHRTRDRLRELRLSPWSGVSGDGAAFRMAAARAALGRLVAATPDLDAMSAPDLVVVAGGAWQVAPGPAIALAVADIVRRPGVTQVAFDHARLLAPLGTIEAAAERRGMLADLADDLLAPLGTVVMPQGLRGGRSGGRLVVHGQTGTSELDLAAGGLELVDLPPGESAMAEFQFRDAVRLGARGRHFAVDVAGGLGGLIVDLRDVPLRLPERADRRRELLAAWQGALWPGMDE